MGGQPYDHDPAPAPTDDDELEPSTLWKSRLKARIEQNLDFLIQDAREALLEALSSARSDAEANKLREQFKKDTAHLGLLAHEQYEMELRKERAERQALWGGVGGVGLGGVVVEEDEDEVEDDVVREQREILEAIRRSQMGHQRNMSSSSSASYSSSPGAGPSYTNGRYAREDSGGSRQRTFSSASSASRAAAPVAGPSYSNGTYSREPAPTVPQGSGHQRTTSSSSTSYSRASASAPVAGPSYTNGRYSRETTPAPRVWTPSIPNGGAHQRTTSSSSTSYSRTAPVAAPSYTNGRYSRESTPAPRTWTPAIPESGRARTTSTLSTSPTSSYPRSYTPAATSIRRDSTSTPAYRTWTPAPRTTTPILVPASSFRENRSPNHSPSPSSSFAESSSPLTSTSWSAPSRAFASTSPPASASSSWTPPSRLNTPSVSLPFSTSFSTSFSRSSTPLISPEQRLAQQEAYRQRAEEIQRKRAQEKLMDQLNWAESISSAFNPPPAATPPPPSPPPQAPSPELDENTVLTLLLSHEHLWSLLATSTGPLTWSSFPWPLLCPPHLDKLTLPRVTAYVKAPCAMGMAPADSERERIKELLRRWHPDRFEVKFLGRVREEEGERVRVREGAGVVVRLLNELLGRLV